MTVSLSFTPEGYPVDEHTPKDRPILAWCDHAADEYVIENDNQGRRTLTLYAAHADSLSHCEDGFHVLEWGGAFDDSTWEYPNQASLPDWWFVKGSEFEIAANPVRWWPLPADLPLTPVPGASQ